MDLFKNKYRIKSARWQGYDYSRDGFYFITICTKNKELFFGDVAGGKMMLSGIGEIADKCWLKIPEHFPFVKLDFYVVMPNHVHGILQIDNGDDAIGAKTQNFASISHVAKSRHVVETQNFASLRTGDKTQNRDYKNKFGPQSKNLSSIIRGYKIGVKKYATMNNIDFAWQARFHDRVIRDGNELNRIRQYIIDNPSHWELDRNNKNDLYI